MHICPDHLYALLGRDHVQPGDQYTVTPRGPECSECEVAHEADATATRRAA